MKVDTSTLRRLAVMAEVDPRTVAKVLDGKRLRGMSFRRVLIVLRREGLLPEQFTADAEQTAMLRSVRLPPA